MSVFKVITVVRFRKKADGTFGRMRLPSGKVLFTCEKPWNDNKVGESCIPEGRYLCQPRRYNKGGYDTFEITGVPGRSAILIHKGNSDENVKGCIAVGRVYPLYLPGMGLSVGDSAGAFSDFISEMIEPFYIDISFVDEEAPVLDQKDIAAIVTKEEQIQEAAVLTAKLNMPVIHPENVIAPGVTTSEHKRTSKMEVIGYLVGGLGLLIEAAGLVFPPALVLAPIAVKLGVIGAGLAGTANAAYAISRGLAKSG